MSQNDISPRDFGRLEGKIDALIDKVEGFRKEHRREFNDLHADHTRIEKRVVSLEHDRTRMYAFVGFLSVTAGIVWNILLKMMGK